eukprot:EG_transcript_25632
MAPPDPLTVLTPQELVQGLATACDTARCEEMQAAALLRQFRGHCELLHTHLLPFASSLCYSLTACLQVWADHPYVLEEVLKTAECASCMLGQGVGALLAVPYAEYLLGQAAWPPRHVKGLRKMMACSGLTVPNRIRLQLEHRGLLLLLPLLQQATLTPAGVQAVSELLKLLATCVALEPFLRQSPYLPHLFHALTLGEVHPDATVRDISQRCRQTAAAVAQPVAPPLAALAPETAEDLLRTLPAPLAT